MSIATETATKRPPAESRLNDVAHATPACRIDTRVDARRSTKSVPKSGDAARRSACATSRTNTKEPRRNNLCIQTQPLAHGPGSACAFDRAATVTERLRPLKHLVSLLFRGH